MGLDCVITIKGSGNPQQSNAKLPSKDRTGEVRSLLIFMEGYYTAIFNHIKDCKKCDPNEALQEYLRGRRNNPRFRGKTSKGLINLALKYKRQFKNRVPDKTLSEFIWRIGDEGTLIQNYKLLDREEFIKGVEIILRQQDNDSNYPNASIQTYFTRLLSQRIISNDYRSIMITMGCLFDRNKEIPTLEEIERMAPIIDVVTG